MVVFIQKRTTIMTEIKQNKNNDRISSGKQVNGILEFLRNFTETIENPIKILRYTYELYSFENDGYIYIYIYMGL